MRELRVVSSQNQVPAIPNGHSLPEVNFYELDDPVELHGAPVPQGFEAADLATAHASADDQATTFVAGGQVQFGPRTGTHPGGRFDQGAERADVDHPHDETGTEHGVFVPAGALGRQPRHSSSFEAEAVDERAAGR